ARGLGVDRQAARKSTAPVLPWRLRVPLLVEVEKENGVGPNSAELEPGCPLDVFRHGAAKEVHDVGLTALEGCRARRLVRHALEDQPLDARRLPPVALEGLDDDLDTRRGADELVGPRADGRLLAALVPALFDALFRQRP